MEKIIEFPFRHYEYVPLLCKYTTPSHWHQSTGITFVTPEVYFSYPHATLLFCDLRDLGERVWQITGSQRQYSSTEWMAGVKG